MILTCFYFNDLNNFYFFKLCLILWEARQEISEQKPKWTEKFENIIKNNEGEMNLVFYYLEYS